ncbi:hypothetical protein [uncultured Corynebacterium sp.]|uniref:hypothetical protein n=1 Tax=uncultured Corynebacterium sp. TaxID=159447 RepID=UPI0025CD64B0|nr:hypothetical protein [uncultured Corynebacterium sp.]
MRNTAAKSTSTAIRRPAAAIVVAGALVLASCSTDRATDDAGAQQAGAPAGTEASSSKKPSPTRESAEATTTATGDAAIDVDFDSLQQVDPSRFREGTRQSLIYDVDGTKGECFVDDEFVTCIGTAADDVADVEMPPFSGRPGAIMLGSAGAAYTILEGAPPAVAELGTGQWVNFGPIKCAKPDDARLACVSDGAAIAIEGAGRDIVTDGALYDVQGLIATAGNRPPTEYETGTDVLVQAPMVCGAMEGHRLADVVEGEITCAEAMAVLDEYDARKHAEGGGNSLFTSFDGWGCSSPTAARSDELAASAVCEHPDRGIRVEAPA